MLLGALVAPFVVPGPTNSQPINIAQATCPTVYTHYHLLRHVLRYSHRGGDYHASHPTSRQFARLAEMRSCAKNTNRAVYRAMRRAWDRRHQVWAFHRHIDQITPYGKWALPAYIVMRESRGQRCARNSTSTAGGYYQFLDSTWYAYGGKNYGGRWPAACAPDWMQHEVAARAWNGGRGASHWALTA